MPKSLRIPLSRVRIVRGVAGSMLLVGNKRIELPAGKYLSLIECFLSHAGRIVSYKRLAAAMNWRGVGDRFRHCLRQYILQLRTVFRRAKVHAHFAVAEGVGYALCEPAGNKPN
jgi:DNA-binding response OmpR family regulator